MSRLFNSGVNAQNKRGNLRNHLKNMFSKSPSVKAPVQSLASVPLISFPSVPPRVYHQEAVDFINRGDYDAMSRFQFSGSDSLIVCGPTGCGKTTYALVDFVAYGGSMLIVCPTATLCANVLVEWNHILPRKFKGLPLCTYFQPDQSCSRLVTCTSAMFCDYVRQHGAVSFDTIALDEWSNENMAHVEALALLRNLRLGRRYVLLSATPPGIKVPPRTLGQDLTKVECHVPDAALISSIVDTVYDPKWYVDRGNGIICAAVQSEYASDNLASLLDNMHVRVRQIDARTSPEDFVKYVSGAARGDYFVVTPDCLVGVTIPMGVFILSGRVESLEYADGLVLRRQRTFTRSELTQAFGRAARVVPTIVMCDTAACQETSFSDVSFYEANAAVVLVAHGVAIQTSSVAHILRKYPKIGTLSRRAAQVACTVSPQKPLLGAFYVDASGELYDFAGGTATTFLDDNATSLSVYGIGSENFVAPFVDLTDDTDPTAWLPQRQQVAMGSRIARVRGVKVPDTLAGCAAAFVKHYDQFRVVFHQLVDDFTDGAADSGVGYNMKYDKYNTMSDDEILARKAFELEDYLGQATADFFNKLAPAGIWVDRTHEIDRDCTHQFDKSVDKDGKYTNPEEKSIGIYYKFMINYDGMRRLFKPASKAPFFTGNSLDTAAVAKWWLDELRPLLATVWIKESGSDAYVELNKFETEIRSSHHVWLNQHI